MLGNIPKQQGCSYNSLDLLQSTFLFLALTKGGSLPHQAMYGPKQYS